MSSSGPNSTSQSAANRSTTGTYFTVLYFWPKPESLPQLQFMALSQELILEANGTCRKLTDAENAFVDTIKIVPQIRVSVQLALATDWNNSPNNRATIKDYESEMQSLYRKQQSTERKETAEDLQKVSDWIWQNRDMQTYSEQFGPPVMSDNYSKLIPEIYRTKLSKQPTFFTVMGYWPLPKDQVTTGKEAPFEVFTCDAMLQDDGTFRELTEDEKKFVATFSDGPISEVDRFFDSAKDLSDSEVNRWVLHECESRMQSLHFVLPKLDYTTLTDKDYTQMCEWKVRDEDLQMMARWVWENSDMCKLSKRYGALPVLSREYSERIAAIYKETE